MPATPTKKFHVTRHVTVVQSAAVAGNSESDAIEKSRKLPFKAWATVDRKRRKNYGAAPIRY